MKFLFFIILTLIFVTGCAHKKAELPASAEKLIDQAVIDEHSFAPFPGETCITPDKTKIQIIFFHGMDTGAPSPQFLSQLALLKEISQTHSAKIYVPRASDKCPGYRDEICWGWNFERKETLKVLNEVIAKSKSCLTRKVPVVLLGFSNGANLLTNWFALPNPPALPYPVQRVIVSGAGTTLVLNQNLPRRPWPLILLAGNLDNYNFLRSKRLYEQLRVHSQRVRFYDFNGDHNLDKPSLLKALQ